jgi:hypothetical protein
MVSLKAKTKKATLVLKANPDCLCELGLIASCIAGAFGSRNVGVNEEKGTIRESLAAEEAERAAKAVKAMMKELDIEKGSVTIKYKD